MANQTQIREQITNQIIAALESGSVPPWRRPWRLGKNAGPPANVVTKRSYRGSTRSSWTSPAQTHGFSSRWWATFNQWKQLGGRVMPRPAHVPPGRVGHADRLLVASHQDSRERRGEEEEDRFFVLRMYTVFNIDQVSGDHLDHLRAGQPDTGEAAVIDYEPAEEAIEATGASIRYGGGKAFYSPAEDSIQVPPKAKFDGVGRVLCDGLARTLPLERAREPPELVPQGEGEHLCNG